MASQAKRSPDLKGTPPPTRYAQLVAYLQRSIQDGTFAAGAQVPTEHELMATFQVSRGTVRHAMSTLVNEGWLERVRGRGTFVLPERTQPPPAELPPATEKRLGVILSHPGGEMELRVLIGIESAARERGYAVAFSYTDEDAQQQANDVRRLRQDRVAGLIIFPIRDLDYDASIHELQAARVPCVLIDRYLTRLDSDCVMSDNVGAGFRATDHLLMLGHTRVGFVHSHSGTLATTSVRDRWRGYQQALEVHKVAYNPALVWQSRRFLGIQDDFEEFLSRRDLPSAVLAATDHVALAFMQAVVRRGLVIPDDIALVGCDNLMFTAHLNPPLTTMAQNFSELGARASRLLMNRIEGMDSPPRHITVPIELIVRESCGAKLRARSAGPQGWPPGKSTPDEGSTP